MTYSLTERKRIRKSFAKRAIVQKVPFLIATQLESYTGFLQAHVAPGEPQERRAAGGVHLDLPDRQPLGQRAARVRELFARRAAVRRQGMPAARPDLREPAARQGAPGDPGQGSAQADDQGSEGAGGVHGRDPAHDHHRLVHHQRHRARHRLPAAPLAGRVLRARPRQDALLGKVAVFRTRDSVPRLVARLRVRPEGHRVLPRRPAPQDAGDDPAQGARLHARAHPRRVLRLRHLPRQADGRRVRGGARAPARRGRALRHQRQVRQDHRRQGQAHHGEAHPRHGEPRASSASARPTTSSSAARWRTT